MPTHQTIRRHSKEPLRQALPIHSFYTIADESRRLTIKVSMEQSENTSQQAVKATPITGVMRGHKQFIGLGQTASQAIRDCLAKIIGRPIQSELNASSQKIIFGSDLVTDPLAGDDRCTQPAPIPIEKSQG